MDYLENYLIGIDLGTTNVKAIIMGEDGTIVAQASNQNSLIFPGTNMVEQDANLWWENTADILRKITATAGTEIVSRIKGISISSQTVTMLPLDKDGNTLRNALIWMDSRSASQLDYIINTIGFDRYVQIIGGQPDVAFLPNKLLWFKENEPELFAKTHKVLQASSFLNFKLTGKMTMDIDQASRCQCLDIITMEWSKEIADVVGIDFNQILPTPNQISDIIGVVTEEAAKSTGLISGIPVIAGASDAMASMYSTGLSSLGEAAESSGTTSLVFIGSDVKSASDIPVVTKPCSIDGMPYVFDAPINTSGASLKWFLDTFGKEEKDFAEKNNINVYEYLNQIASKTEAGSNGVLFFPYLLGERAPLWNSYARGMFIGMSLDTSKDDLIRSVFEGTSFALRHVFETITVAGGTANCLRITGGGAKSKTWSQIKASMLRMPIYLLDEKSGEAPFGDALIAGQAVGVFKDLSATIKDLVHVVEVIEPNEEWAAVYDKLYPYYKEMYQNLDVTLKNYKDTLSNLHTN